MMVVFWVFTSCTVLCSDSLEEHTASVFRLTSRWVLKWCVEHNINYIGMFVGICPSEVGNGMRP
jgi:hypothetical protein